MMLDHTVWDGSGSLSVGMGSVRARGDDANASAPSSVAIEQQQDLPFPFFHWFSVLTKILVVQARTNKIKLMLLSSCSILKRQHALAL